MTTAQDVAAGPMVRLQRAGHRAAPMITAWKSIHGYGTIGHGSSSKSMVMERYLPY